MPIQNTNFTSSLLKPLQNQTQSIKVEDNTNVTPPAQEEVQTQEQAPVTDVINEEKPNHDVRNWSIGLGAAATLIGLGVAGRKGHLGKGLQKLLGGAEKESGKLADDAVGSAAGHAKPTPETISETAVRETKPEPVKPETPAATETPVAPKAETTTETAVSKAEAEAAEAIKPGVKSVKGDPITKAEIDAIEATLDKTLPKITDDMLHVDVSKLPSPESYEKLIFEELKIPKYGKPSAYSEQTFTYEGENVSAWYDKDGKLSSINFMSLDGKYQCFTLNNSKVSHIYSTESTIFYGANGQVSSFSLSKDGHDYWYNSAGELKDMVYKNAKGEKIKDIDFIPGSSKIKQIKYREAPEYEVFSFSKIEKFEDDKLVQETYHPQGTIKMSFLLY